MSHHSTSFEIERPVPDDFTAQPDKLRVSTSDKAADTPVAHKKFNLRKVLMAGAAVAVIAGAAGAVRKSGPMRKPGGSSMRPRAATSQRTVMPQPAWRPCPVAPGYPPRRCIG